VEASPYQVGPVERKAHTDAAGAGTLRR